MLTSGLVLIGQHKQQPHTRQHHKVKTAWEKHNKEHQRPLYGPQPTHHPQGPRQPNQDSRHSGQGHTGTPQQETQLHKIISVVIAGEQRPAPFRTRKLRPPAPMVLHPPGCGRVGHRRAHTKGRAPNTNQPPQAGQRVGGSPHTNNHPHATTNTPTRQALTHAPPSARSRRGTSSCTPTSSTWPMSTETWLTTLLLSAV